jgi:iron-sulfur cluster repair protein YtfE (RIC family)
MSTSPNAIQKSAGSKNAIARLKRDHRILHAKLNVIEALLRMGPDAWYVLREIAFTLSRQLQHHMRREEQLIAACRNAMNPTVLAEIALEHRDEPEHLRAIQRLFLDEPSQTLERIGPALTRTIQGLRRHMAEEEAELFPLLERELGARETAAAEQPAARHVQECMTPNRVVRDYPQTKAVFERLFINLPYDGCTCLDEVAWQHGMESEQLLAELEKVITPGQPLTKHIEKEQSVCACR